MARRRKRSRILSRVTYVGARLVAALLGGLPFRWALALAEAAGDLLFLIDRRHRRIAEENLARAYGPDLDPVRRRRWVREVYRYLFGSVVEVIFFHRRVTAENWRDFVDVMDWDESRAREIGGTGVIFLTAHLGNWEVAGISLALLGYPMTSIERPLDNPYLSRHVHGLRERYGMKMVAKHEAMRAAAAALGRGECVGLLGDQYARKGSIPVEFFGGSAWTTRSVGRLAVRFGVPVVTGYAVRDGRGLRFRFFIDRPIWPRTGEGVDRDEEVRRITQEFTTRIEGYVRQHPTRWLWLHRRWQVPGSVRAMEVQR